MARMCPRCGLPLPGDDNSACPYCGAHPFDQIQVGESPRDISLLGSGMEEPLVEIVRFSTPEEAELARVYLETQGIKAARAGIAELGSVLSVRESDGEQALRLLKIAALRKKQDPAVPLNRMFSMMVSGAVILIGLFLILVLLTVMFRLF